MHKKIRPKVLSLSFLGTIPHCDQRILHAPGECEHCDERPEWQALRQLWGIAFTGYEPGGNELPDPATNIRDFDVLNAWGGNKAKPHA